MQHLSAFGLFCLTIFGSVALAPVAAQEFPLHGESKLILASVAKGQELLGQVDEYSAALTRFDLESRLKTRDNATTAQLLKHAAAQVRPWEESEARQLARALGAIRGGMSGLRSNLFPAEVYVIKTTGLDEGRAAYCRGNAVILPQNMIDRPPEGNLAKLLAHELFHILSRQSEELRREMFQTIGFSLTKEIPLPDSLAERKITNPDAPLVNCVITLDQNGKPFNGAPLLYANAERYDPARGGTFFAYMKFALLEVEQHDGQWRAKLNNGEPVLLDPSTDKSYFEQIGKNTGYIIHPEEILAENFSLLLTAAKNLPSPQVVERLADVLAADNR